MHAHTRAYARLASHRPLLTCRRPLQEDGYPAFVGGGAGIVLSRAGALVLAEMQQSDECDPLHLKWVDRIHQGGDAWLGDCADVAGLFTEMEYGFYPQPPVANLFNLYKDAVAFHGIEDHIALHHALEAYHKANGTDYAAVATLDPRCACMYSHM